MRGLFQSERANMLRMSEVNAVDHQAMQHMLTEGAVNWNGLTARIAVETDAVLGGATSVLIFDESAFAKKGNASAGSPGSGMAAWARSTTARSACSRRCAGARWPV